MCEKKIMQCLLPKHFALLILTCFSKSWAVKWPHKLGPQVPWPDLLAFPKTYLQVQLLGLVCLIQTFIEYQQEQALNLGDEVSIDEIGWSKFCNVRRLVFSVHKSYRYLSIRAHGLEEFINTVIANIWLVIFLQALIFKYKNILLLFFQLRQFVRDGCSSWKDYAVFLKVYTSITLWLLHFQSIEVMYSGNITKTVIMTVQLNGMLSMMFRRTSFSKNIIRMVVSATVW